MIYIGVDPGKSGALAAIDQEGKILKLCTFDEQTYRDSVAELYNRGEGIRCLIEKVGAMPKQGVSSTFNFGANFGWIQGLMFAFFIPYQLVTPRKWKNAFSLNSEKADSIRTCKELFPDANLRRTERCKTDHDGMAEALLMAEYARRYF